MAFSQEHILQVSRHGNFLPLMCFLEDLSSCNRDFFCCTVLFHCLRLHICGISDESWHHVARDAGSMQTMILLLVLLAIDIPACVTAVLQ